MSWHAVSPGLLALLAMAAVAAIAPGAQAQRSRTPCSFSSDRASADSTVGVGQVGYLGGNVVIRCPERGITLHGDSAERRADGDHIIGHAVFDEPRIHVTSQFLNYFPDSEIVNAVNDVHASLPNGSTLVGPFARLLRPIPKIRPRRQLSAIARPTIKLVQLDSTKKASDTTTIVANQVFMDGDSLVYGGGQVVITRPDIMATSDSAFIDQTHDVMHLMRTPAIRGRKEHPFTLRGDLLDLYSRNHKLQRVLARANAVAVSDSMTLKSDTIDLRVRNDLLDHAYAWGMKSRARVVSATQNVLADSLDVFMPGQKLQLVRAVRKAFAEGKTDTLKFHIAGADSTDWLKGDTIVAHFDTLARKDTSKTPPIKLLTADGHASSFYHVAPSDTAEKQPAISYVDAHHILISFDSQKVATVTAIDSVHGLYIEPKADSASRRGKSNAKPGTVTTTPAGRTPAKRPATPPAKPPTQPPVKPPDAPLLDPSET